jgi:hypothetical protein
VVLPDWQLGWFTTPTTAKAAMDVASQTAPFALAFLGGFSIELLFSILDRILAALNPKSRSENFVFGSALRPPISRTSRGIGATSRAAALPAEP